MTIKIEAWQAHGIKTDECRDKFEFCCWKALKIWLDGYGIGGLHGCKEHYDVGKGMEGRNK